jgi:hypothetical protein
LNDAVSLYIQQTRRKGLFNERDAEQIWRS